LIALLHDIARFHCPCCNQRERNRA
jgi:hypothetical protein